jgi:hypothetical protein
MSAWTTAAANHAITFGWRVRALTFSYAAPRLPLTRTLAAAAAKRYPDNAIAVANLVQRYRAVAIRSAPTVARELVAAHDRCPQRTILIAGYSEGATVLRHAISRLPQRVRQMVASIDLIGDPTADRRVDSKLTHTTRPTTGIDTAVTRNRAANGKRFTQHRYPLSAPRVRQWCGRNDLVCDVVYGRSLVPHDRYPWATIGTNAIASLPGLLPFVLVGLEASFVPVNPPNAKPIDFGRGLCGPVSRYITTGTSSYEGGGVTMTENLPSVGGWFVGLVNSLFAEWHTDSLTYARVSLMAQTPGSQRWPVLASSQMTLVFSALPFSRNPCTPLETEDSALGPAYPAMVFHETYGEAPHFWGCGYISISGSDPNTVRVLITNARDPSATGLFTCKNGDVVPGAP